MRVLIVGAGIGGLALAGLLKQRGIKASIVEKAKNWKREGFSIGIWHNGLRVLQELGIREQFDEKGYVLPDYHLCDGDGNIIKLTHFEEYKEKFKPPRTQIARGQLYALLQRATRGIPKRLGTTVTALRQTTNEVIVTLSDGKKERYDVVIGADGIFSQIRDLMFGDKNLKYLNWRGWFFWTDRKILGAQVPRGVVEICEPKKFFGLFPHGERKICTYIAMPCMPSDPDEPENRIQKLKNHFKDISYIVPKVLDAIKDPHTMIRSDLAYVDMEKWHKGRVILIGDAAHAMEPFAGMGASMAMEDALVLADELSEETPDSITLAFERYAERRSVRIKLAQKQTRKIWYWTETDYALVNAVRKLVSPLIPIQHFTKGFEELLKKPI